MANPSRRNFLRGNFSSTNSGVTRPPWALAEEAFLAVCSRCGDCARACPTRIVVQGAGGYPAIDFAKGECTFCGECASHCQPAALRRNEGAAPWSLRAEIGDGCLARQAVECRVCGEMCEPAAIRFQPRLGGAALPLLDGERCTGCGACVAPCPASAILIR